MQKKVRTRLFNRGQDLRFCIIEWTQDLTIYITRKMLYISDGNE